MKKFLLLLLISLPLVTSCSKDEEESFATLYGIISDSSTGKAVSHATVTLSPGGVTKQADGDGRYEYTDLTPQQYTVTVQATGYSTNRKTATAIVGEKVEVNISLNPLNR